MKRVYKCVTSFVGNKFFFNRAYGVFCMAPGESSCLALEGSEYVWQRGLSCGRPKLILVSRFVATKKRRNKNLHFFFHPTALKRIKHGIEYGEYMFNSFQINRTKNKKC